MKLLFKFFKILTIFLVFSLLINFDDRKKYEWSKMNSINFNELPNEIPIVAETDSFLYPFMISPIFLENSESIASVEYAMNNNLPIIIAPLNKNVDEDNPMMLRIFPAGVIGSVVRKVALPDGRTKILFQGIKKVRVITIEEDNVTFARFTPLVTDEYHETRANAILQVLKEKASELSKLNAKFPSDMLNTINDSSEIERIADLVTSSLNLSLEDAYQIFIETSFEERLLSIIDKIDDEIEVLKVQKDIRSKVQTKMQKHNKEHILKEQMKQIQKELGVDTQREEEIEEYRKKLEAKKKFIKEEAYKEIEKQLKRLSRMHPESADANTLQTYIEWVLEIPFGKESKKKLKISDVETQLNEDHYSLVKPKDRILEYFAVKELMELRGISNEKGKGRGAILCFVGPPGVGKTSLANSIADAMKRSLVRIALGGLEDVNELRGHRRTYVGAMPGRMTQGLIEAKEMNPVVVLDEIDKVGRSHRGDPTAVMLEILDPEQNSNFRDYYLNFDLDLSKVTFIATANDIGSIPSALRDRMEFISLTSYTPQEKFQISKKYLIPQELKKHGLKSSEVVISKKALEDVISLYTREAGVRNLRRRIAEVMRKSARRILQDDDLRKVSISVKNLKEFLDKTVFEIEKVENKPKVGVVYGLAWTAVGGDILKIEVSKNRGKGAMKLTGKLGDVMKESGVISMSVVKGLFDRGVLKSEEEEPFTKYDIHIHVPDGATPKDGPSAGITMTTAIASIFSNRKVRGDTAMTGEISLHGDVMPIGGLKEKIIAAHKGGIAFALIPKKNFERDLVDIPDEVKETMTIIPVSRIEEVLDHMLL
jgi:ATP-dependent Lon protease